MRYSVTRLWLLILLAAGQPLQAQQSQGSSLDSLPEELLLISDVILSRHVLPPTRQEMVLGASRAICDAVKVATPARLSEQISGLAQRAELLQFLGELCDRARSAEDGSAAHVREAAIEGLLKTVRGAPHLIPDKEAKVQEQFQGNRYVGIGVALYLDTPRRVPRINVLHGGPAKRAGARTGDLILEIDGQPTEGSELKQVVDLLRGDEGTSVTLAVREPEAKEVRTLQITRGLVVNPTIEGYRSLGENRWDFRIPSKPIAYIRVGLISASTVHELRQLERELSGQGVAAIILDLRQSDGGTIHHTALLADALLAGGPIGRVRTVDGVRCLEASEDCLFRNWPMAVLAWRATSRTQEWLVAGLQDRGRAIVIGERTSGYGMASETVPLPGFSESIVLATALLERIDGRPLQNPGRSGELVFPASAQQLPPRRGGEPGNDIDSEYGVTPDYHVPQGTSGLAADAVVRTAVRILEEHLGRSATDEDEAPVEAPSPADPGALER